MLIATSCATSASDIRARGAYDSFIIAKPYKTVSQCVTTALVEKHDAGLTVRQDATDRTVVTEPVEGGGYFVEITPISDVQTKVATYASQNMLFFDLLSSQLIKVAKENCL